jgi:cell division protein ZipA
MRQALNGCGLVHGPQDIFHWVDESGQVIASAANLLRPGSFDLATMDAQDFPGLHLFSVLPGPLDPLHAFDELLGLARDLATRLNGLVQDERGRTVDAQAVEALRQALADALAGKGPAA